MARNQKLEGSVRDALAGIPNVTEKQMFRGTAFMINEKLCVSAGDEELMFRFDPAQHEETVKQPGCREMLRNGKSIKGYVYVHQSRLQTPKDLERWMARALEFNKKAKSSKKAAK